MNSVFRLSKKNIFHATKWCSAVVGATCVFNPIRLYCASAETTTKLSIKGTPEYNNLSFTNKENEFLFMTTISAPLIDTQNRSAVDLLCVLDESGSMSGKPIQLLKDSMKFIVSNLTSNDRFGCVGYDSNIRIISDMKYMTSTVKQETLKAIDLMDAGSCTALCEGLETGVNMMRDTVVNDVEKQMDSKNRIKNILLLTDGQANVGYTDPKDIIHALNDKEFADKGREASICKKDNMISRLQELKNSIGMVDLMTGHTQEDIKTIYSELPCSLDCFGVGNHHDAKFLTMLSEYGRGLFTYISGAEDIAGTFGEMLGGMLSVVGKDVKVQVKTLSDNVKISKCLAMQDNSTLQLKEIEKDKHYEIQLLNDMQSEENRDLLFELVIPKIDAVNDEWNYIHIQLEYFNIISDQKEQISTVCQIQRPSDSLSVSKVRNYDIDIQYNRIMSTAAIKRAIEIADKGDLEGAKKIIQDAKVLVSNSVSKDDTYCQSLINDLDVCIQGMESKAVYESYGSTRTHSFRGCQVMQRTYQAESAMTNMESLGTWSTKAKKVWRSKAETETQQQTK